MISHSHEPRIVVCTCTSDASAEQHAAHRSCSLLLLHDCVSLPQVPSTTPAATGTDAIVTGARVPRRTTAKPAMRVVLGLALASRPPAHLTSGDRPYIPALSTRPRAGRQVPKPQATTYAPSRLRTHISSGLTQRALPRCPRSSCFVVCPLSAARFHCGARGVARTVDSMAVGDG
jgi:hypothetical protein